MKQLLTMMSLLVAGLMFLPSTASAGLVTIDNFSKTGDASLNGVDRMSSGHSFFFQGSGFVYAAPNVGTLEYTKNSDHLLISAKNSPWVFQRIQARCSW